MKCFDCGLPFNLCLCALDDDDDYPFSFEETQEPDYPQDDGWAYSDFDQ